MQCSNNNKMFADVIKTGHSAQVLWIRGAAIFTTSKNRAAVFLVKSEKRKCVLSISIWGVKLAIFYSPLAKLHLLHYHNHSSLSFSQLWYNTLLIENSGYNCHQQLFDYMHLYSRISDNDSEAFQNCYFDL